MATADWNVASRERDTGKQLIERSAIRNSCGKQHRRHKSLLAFKKENWFALFQYKKKNVYLCCALAPPREGIKEANASWGHQQQGKNDIVHRGEVHLHHLPHDEDRRGGAGRVKAFGNTASERLRLQCQREHLTHRETCWELEKTRGSRKSYLSNLKIWRKHGQQLRNILRQQRHRDVVCKNNKSEGTVFVSLVTKSWGLNRNRSAWFLKI